MSHDALSIAVRKADNGRGHVFTLSGSLDLATSPTVRAALVEAAERGEHEIVVDLTQLEFIDSTGLGALIGGHRRTREAGGQVRLVAREGQILRLLRVTGLLSVFSVYPSVEDALADTERLVGL